MLPFSSLLKSYGYYSHSLVFEYGNFYDTTPVRTVQFYDTKGVLCPSELTEGGRRIYSDDDLTKLRLICVLKAIGLSLDSIKSVMESELSKKILAILLDEQVMLLSGEIGERQKQLEMITIIKESISGKTVVPANTILDVEHIMEKKNKTRNTKKLMLIYMAVGIVSALGLLFMAWLVVSRIWWGLAVYISIAILGLSISTYQLKDNEFICPKCDSVFKPSLRHAFFTTGSHIIRWTKCPECGHKDWCVIRKHGQVRGTESNG